MFVFFCVDVFCGAKFIAKPVLLVRPLRCLHREDFENFEGHPVGWVTLAWGDSGWLVGWMLGVFFS